MEFPEYDYCKSVVNKLLIFDKDILTNSKYTPMEQFRKILQPSAFEKLFPETYVNVTPEMVENVCSICLNPFHVGLKVKKTKCNHIFHKECINSWLEKNLTCPICRTVINETNSKLLDQNYLHMRPSFQIPYSLLGNRFIYGNNLV